ncbi:hypothetical protein E2C01_070931 [Portunus trituberculatus]|uniref:Uncharacterized protein n=1 Tax=Portunus trituberculatus TaxID=210409 RepID=A0A5B7I2Y3_PORTR|nr:hypothetical protein [Portunus trituberculatus]
MRSTVAVLDNSTTGNLFITTPPHPHLPLALPATLPLRHSDLEHLGNKLVQVRQSDNMRSFFLLFSRHLFFFSHSLSLSFTFFFFCIELSPSISLGIVISAVRLTFRISNISLCTLYIAASQSASFT